MSSLRSIPSASPVASVLRIASVIAIAGCGAGRGLPGPARPEVALVERIVVTSLEPGPRRCRSIEERGRIESALASWAFAEQGREPADGRSLLPLYRIDLQLADGAARVCWLGTNSHPPRFPCYGLRSGWWLAPSTGGGVLDPSRYRGLPESVYFELLDGLDILSVDDLPEVPAEAACPPAPTAP